MGHGVRKIATPSGGIEKAIASISTQQVLITIDASS